MAANQRIYVELVADVGPFSAGLKDASSQVSTLDKGLSKLQKGGLLALTTGVALVARETLALDTAMRNVNSISGMTEGALKGTTQELLDMSTRLPQSASTLAEGLYDIASSGFQGADGMKVLDAAATAASAGMTDTAVSAKAITAALNAYGRGAEDAADVADTLFSTVNLGVTTFEQLANNVGDYIGVANAVGASFAETGSAIATLTLTGTNAAEAGTVLGSVLSGLVKPTDALTAVLEEAGYASGSAAVEALGLRGTMELVREASGGTAEGMATLFGDVTAVRGALGLATDSGETYAGVAGKMEDASARAGASQKALAEQAKSLSYQLKLAYNDALATGIELGNLVKPAALRGLAGLRQLGEEAETSLDSLGAGVLKLGDALGPTFENLQSIGVDVIDIFEQVYDSAQPLVALLGTAVIGGLVVGLEAVTTVLEPMIGLLTDSEAAFHLLALAITIAVIPAAVNAAAVLGGSLVMAMRIATTQMAALRAGAVSASGAVAAMGGPIGVAIAAFAALAIGLDFAVSKLEDTPPSAGAMSKALLELADSGRVTGALLQVVGKDFDGFTESIQRVADLQQLAAEGFEIPEGAKAVSNEIKAIDDGLAAMVQNGHADLAAEAFGRFKQAQGDLSDGEFQDLFPGYQDAMDGAAASTQLAAEEAENKAAADREMATEAAAAAEATKSLTDRLIEQVDALRAMYDPIFAMQKATRDHAEAQTALTDAIKEHGKGSKEAEDAQWALLESTVGVTDAATRLKGAVADGSVSLGQSKAQLATWVRQGLLTQAQAEVLAGEIEGVTGAANKLSATPAAPKVSAPGLQATDAGITRLSTNVRQLDGQTATVRVNLQGAQAVYGSIAAIERRAANVAAVAGPRPLKKADGGYISGPGTTTSDSIPALLSDREYVQRAAAVDFYGVPFMDAVNSLSFPKPQRLAAGGPVRLAAGSSPLPRNASLSGEAVRVAARGGGVEGIRALVRAWEDYNRALEQAARRRELVKDAADARREFAAAKGMEARTRALEGLNRANQALRDFDLAASRDREREAVDQLIDRLDAEAEARQDAARAAQEAAEKRREVEDNMAERGAIALADYLRILDERIAAEQEFTNEWMSLVTQRERLVEAAQERERDRLKQLADAARAAADETADAAGEALRAQEQGLGRLIDLVEREAALRDSLVRLDADYARRRQQVQDRAVKAEQDYLRGVAEVQADQVQAAQAYAAARERTEVEHGRRLRDLVAQRAAGILSGLQADQVLAMGWGNTVGQLTGNVAAQADAIAEWAAQLAAARTRGVSEEVIGALGLDQGPQALGQLRQFTGATEAEIAALNEAVARRQAEAGTQAQRERDAELGRLGADLAAARAEYEQQQETAAAAYGEQQAAFAERLTGLGETFTTAQQELAAELAVMQAELIAEQEAVRLELERLGTDQGLTYGQALAAGLRSSIPGVRAAAEELQRLAAQTAAAQSAADQARAAADAAAAAAAADIAAPQAGTSDGPRRRTTAPGPRDARQGQATSPSAADAARALIATVDITTLPKQTAANDALIAGLSPGQLTARQMAYADLYGIKLRTYDVGGWLQPGYTLAYNGTGAPERVMTAQQQAAATAPGDVHVHVNAPVFGVDDLHRTIVGAVHSTLGAQKTARQIAGTR
jgi:TP901 family phage tail tape measure protein